MALTDNDLARFAHLMRRAGFGARADDYSDFATIDLEKATEKLLHPENVVDPVDSLLQELGDDYFDFDDHDSLKRWWLFRMGRTRRPLVEKMTLFWHNHFATAVYKVGNVRWMYGQNQLLRANALGSFPTLLKAMVHDPAMLSWLDGGQNKKGAPNENFARELMELFTLGVGGGYNEVDVKQAARAFTGWTCDYNSSQPVFDVRQFDDGSKKFLGYDSRLNSDDIINIVVRHPSTAKFVCGKLARFFIGDSASPQFIETLAATFAKNHFEIRPVVAQILHSPEFYSDAAMYGKIKSPVEYSVSLMRTLGAPLTAGNQITGALNEMGQDLFNPPNVKGWVEGESWLNTATLMARRKFVLQVCDVLGRHNRLPEFIRTSLKGVGRDDAKVQTPETLVDSMWFLMMPGRTPSEKTRAALVTYARGSADKPKPDEKPVDFNRRAPGLLALIVGSPEYQLC